ncbi:hypothetical protein L9F63_016544, partial [Diploptera punctata]
PNLKEVGFKMNSDAKIVRRGLLLILTSSPSFCGTFRLLNLSHICSNAIESGRPFMMVFVCQFVLLEVLKLAEVFLSTKCTCTCQPFSYQFDDEDAAKLFKNWKYNNCKTGFNPEISPHLYMSPSSHCDDIKAMNNFLPSTLESRRSLTGDSKLVSRTRYTEFLIFFFMHV